MARIRKTDTPAPPPTPEPGARVGTVASEIVGSDLTTQPAAVRLPTAEPSPLFLLLYRPDRLQIIGGRMLPALHKLELLPGASNVDGTAARPNASVAIAEAQRRGWEVIPYRAHPSGSYMRRTQVRGGWAHHLWCESLLQGSDRSRTDHDAYADWLEGLMSDGTLTPIMPHAVEAAVERLEQERARLSDRATVQPSAAADLRSVEAALAAARARLAEIDNPVAVAETAGAYMAEE